MADPGGPQKICDPSRSWVRRSGEDKSRQRDSPSKPQTRQSGSCRSLVSQWRRHAWAAPLKRSGVMGLLLPRSIETSLAQLSTGTSPRRSGATFARVAANENSTSRAPAYWRGELVLQDQRCNHPPKPTDTGGTLWTALPATGDYGVVVAGAGSVAAGAGSVIAGSVIAGVVASAV